jgi:hypothetical protein
MTDVKTITPAEAAKRLGVTSASIYLYVKQGLLVNLSLIKGQVILDPTAVENFTPRPCGRRAGYRKENAKHPRLQLYYERKKRGNHDSKESHP